MPTMTTLHLIDGTYELFRAHFGAPPRQTPDGWEIGATEGILRSTLNLLQQDGVTLIDLRDPREIWRDGGIPDAINVTRGMLEFWIDPGSPYHKEFFDSGNKFVFFCAGGVRSALAAKTAQDMGLTPVCHIAGGFTAWKKSGAPVVTVEPRLPGQPRQ